MKNITTPTTICINEIGEYSIWRHVERREFDVFFRRLNCDRSFWIGWASGPAEAGRLAGRHAEGTL